MTIRQPTYIELIGEFFPNCYAATIGVSNGYIDLVHSGGDPLPSQAALDAVMLEKIKALACEAVNEYRDSYLFDRFVYDGKRFDCDTTSRSNINGALTIGMVSGNALPPGMTWRDYDNNNWPITFAYMANMAGALSTFTNDTYVSSWTHKANINALTSVNDVNNYNYLSGWPTRDI